MVIFPAGIVSFATTTLYNIPLFAIPCNPLYVENDEPWQPLNPHFDAIKGFMVPPYVMFVQSIDAAQLVPFLAHEKNENVIVMIMRERRKFPGFINVNLFYR